MRRGASSGDLYYRLKVIEIVVPPLRERQDELPHLVEFFVAKYAKRYNRAEPPVSPALRDALQGYSWPGNIRELENVMKRFVILQDETLVLRDVRPAARPPAGVDDGVADDGRAPNADVGDGVPDLGAPKANGSAINAGPPPARSLSEAAHQAMVRGADSHRADVAAGALEPASAAPFGHQLQDVAQQNQRAAFRTDCSSERRLAQNRAPHDEYPPLCVSALLHPSSTPAPITLYSTPS